MFLAGGSKAINEKEIFKMKKFKIARFKYAVDYKVNPGPEMEGVISNLLLQIVQDFKQTPNVVGQLDLPDVSEMGADCKLFKLMIEGTILDLRWIRQYQITSDMLISQIEFQLVQELTNGNISN